MTLYGGPNNLQVPYTCLVTKLRMSKRKSQTQMAQILKQIISLKNSYENRSKEEIMDLLKKSREKLEALRDRLRVERDETDGIYDACRKRVHLDQEAVVGKKELTKQDMMREFDKQVLQFMASRNKIPEARTLQKSLKTTQHLQLYIDLYEKAYHISHSISQNDLRPLKDWCYEHSHYLTKLKSSLQFKLISCGFVNILNNGNGVKAVQFLRKEVATLALTEGDKEEVNGLAFRVLVAQGQGDWEYYSDQDRERVREEDRQKEQERERERERLEKEKASEQKQQKMIEQKQPQIQKEAQKNQPQGIQIELSSSSSSSSSSVQSALRMTQYTMSQIYRAIAQLSQQERQGEVLLSPRLDGRFRAEEREVSLLGPMREMEELQEVYEDKFDSMSEELEMEMEMDEGNGGGELPSMIRAESGKKSNRANGDRIKNQSPLRQKQAIKQIKRKHKLDKNNLRSLLNETRQQFLSAFSKIYQLSFNTHLDKTLAIGMSVLKTQSCIDHPSPSHRGCPTCTHEIQRVIKQIPATLKNESSLICRIDGSLMDESNYPVVLPNGQVYGIGSLRAGERNGKYFCWVEKKWYRKEACRKVFLS